MSYHQNLTQCALASRVSKNQSLAKFFSVDSWGQKLMTKGRTLPKQAESWGIFHANKLRCKKESLCWDSSSHAVSSMLFFCKDCFSAKICFAKMQPICGHALARLKYWAKWICERLKGHCYEILHPGYFSLVNRGRHYQYKWALKDFFKSTFSKIFAHQLSFQSIYRLSSRQRYISVKHKCKIGCL